jgi:hypothetical protein
MQKGNAMKGNRSSVSKASSYKDMGAYWDTHELDEVWDKTRKVKFDVQIESEAIYYAVEKGLSEQVESLAKRQGVSSDTLINLWIQEKIQEQVSR